MEQDWQGGASTALEPPTKPAEEDSTANYTARNTVLWQLNGLLLLIETKKWNKKDNLTANNKGLTVKQQELFSAALGIAAYGGDCQE